MSDYGFPYISYTRLKELKQHAEIVVAAIASGGSFTGSDLWRIYVGLEVNSMLANHWYEQLEKARNYSPSSAEPCPLCVYDDGVFIARCPYHKRIDPLLLENEKLHRLVHKLFQLMNQANIDITSYYLKDVTENLENDKKIEADGTTGILHAESEGNSE